MSIMLWCLVIAAFIPGIIAGVTSVFRAKQLGTIDNKNPRAQYAKLEGVGARLVAAQANAWEALQVFMVCVFIAQVSGADAYFAGLASMVFIGSRVLYVIFYAMNLDILRSIIFTLGMACCVYLVYLSVNVTPMVGT